MKTDAQPVEAPILVTRSSLPDLDEFVREIRPLWESRWLTNRGEKHRQLETALAAYLDVPYVSLFSNGHLALEAALTVLNLQGEVITTPFTFASTTHALVRCGLEPVFCDIRPDDCTMDPRKIESLITERTCAILPVHVYGQVCDAPAIEAIARRHRLPVIYDAAHAFGVKVAGQGVGRLGDLSMFSFHATKVFHTIEGGALTFTNPDYAEPLNQIKNFGITGAESVESVGFNGKMNEFSAAMGLCNLRSIDTVIGRRLRQCALYRSELAGLPGVRLLAEQPGRSPNGAYFPVLFADGQDRRDYVFAQLASQQIFARKYFYPLTSAYACYRDRFSPADTPLARAMAACVLCLPLFPELSSEAVKRICRVIRNNV